MHACFVCLSVLRLLQQPQSVYVLTYVCWHVWHKRVNVVIQLQLKGAATSIWVEIWGVVGPALKTGVVSTESSTDGGT